jgi:hypothetical protein
MKSALYEGVLPGMLTPIPHEFAIGGVYFPPMQSLPLVEVFFLSAVGVTGINDYLYRSHRNIYYWSIVSEAIL